ncbi:hypothetical protein I204_00681 [Kwoniella mangroviensis CBS 8886]|uniref:mitochondrial 37S ribosomal protein mS35 n=1 Tax=Kwoniella mangroviensis CBS 8507 TaxID=1296122 RepID=UPI00080CF715|nr:uncharacterized protein I203_07071 [Kwoniella mangroviensis CBS 8507]OCF63752.1 hypothetical protein I203_07071 [Kwoniella mangroviensis CBS 8507]OCF78737.1 hypothetical protein I204_00681 [Kwoniella mangroviensis CBS 8886]
MSVSRTTLRSLPSSSSVRLGLRSLSSSASSLDAKPDSSAPDSSPQAIFPDTPAAPSSALAKKGRPWSVMNTPKFDFDDATSLGWMRMFRVQEGEGLVRKIEEDREALRAANKTTFTPPTSSIRLTSTIDLSSPSSKFHTKAVLLVPISSLKLSSPDAVQRIKLLAGPRWTPGRPGKEEFLPNGGAIAQSEEGKEGWIKIAEERFGNSRQNRIEVSNILDRLVRAANDPKSPLPADIPIDTRHLLARHRKKRSRQNPFSWSADQTSLKKHEVVGGVKGFPIEWIPEGLREKALKKQ